MLEAALASIVSTSRQDIRHGRVPSLYGSGVRYRSEPDGEENWQTAAETLSRGFGDCEDLAAWRVAELQEQGVAARVRVLVMRPGLWHVVVEHPEGWIEDPSAFLGMYSKHRGARRRRKERRPMPDTENTPSLEPPVADVAGDVVLDTVTAAARDDADAAQDAMAGNTDAVDDDDLGADEPVTPSVRWLTSVRDDGTHDAKVAIRLLDGTQLKQYVHARSRRGAMVRLAQMARARLDDPEIVALIPPQAIVAIKALATLGRAARLGKVAQLMRNVASKNLHRLAQVFA